MTQNSAGSRLRRGLLFIALAALATGLHACAPLEPQSRPPETALAPALAPVWRSLAARPERDEQLLLNEGMEALDIRLSAIDSARSSIDLQTFLWTFDTTGSAVARHLLAAGERGVRVRLLIDDTAVMGRDAGMLEFADHPNIELRSFNPSKQRGVDFVTTEAMSILELRRLDHRMHNKAMIVDGQIAIAGGRNLADEYFGLHDAGNFRDMEVLLRGPVVRDLSLAYDRYWNSPWSLPVAEFADSRVGADALAEGPAPVHDEQAVAELAATWAALFARSTHGPATLIVDRAPLENPAEVSEAPVQVAEYLATLFDSATDEIVILSAYLIPTPELEGAVARAVQRGVRVRILTNSLSSNNHVTAHSAYRNHIRSLIQTGVDLYEVRPDAEDRARYMLPPTQDKELALHAKALLVDRDRVFIGSANLDPRSLRINTEMGLLIESPALNRQLRAAFSPDFSADNAWSLALAENGRLVWTAGEMVLDAQPADSFMQRIEDWFFSTLPIEDEL